MSTQTVKDSSTFLKINSISVNLNNTSGLLSSATAQDLWRISVENHSQQSWPEFSGFTNNAANATGIGSQVQTTGSLLVLSPAYNLSLPDFLSSGSIGQYNFQFSVNVTNIEGETITPEICVICVNSGIFTTVAGSSNIYTGILTKQMVLDAKTNDEAIDPVSSVQYGRMVGGSMVNRIATTAAKMPFVRDFAEKLKRMTGMGVQSGGMAAQPGSKLSKLCY